MEYMVSAYTDIGTAKQTNQDSFCVRRAAFAERGEMTLAVICDGMGGLSKGELASAEGEGTRICVTLPGIYRPEGEVGRE